MILDIAQIQPDVHAGSHFVVCVAAFCEAAEDVGFAAEQLHEAHDVLADHADFAEEGVHVVVAGYEDCVFDGVGFVVEFVDDGGEGIDNVVAVSLLVVAKEGVGDMTYIKA